MQDAQQIPDRNDRSPHGAPATLDNRIPPPILALVTAVAMWAASSGTEPSEWCAGFALVSFLAAGAIGFPTILSFRKSRTTIDPIRINRAAVLVTGGVYGITRNPMYLALALLLIAWALWLGGPLVWAGPVFLVLWLERFQIRPEERAMTARFGDEYRRYQEKVRRWL